MSQKANLTPVYSDNKIEPSEFRAAIGPLFAHLLREDDINGLGDVDAMFEVMDLDQSGSISFEEFKMFLENITSSCHRSSGVSSLKRSVASASQVLTPPSQVFTPPPRYSPPPPRYSHPLPGTPTPSHPLPGTPPWANLACFEYAATGNLHFSNYLQGG